MRADSRSDAALLGAARDGDGEAYGHLVARHARAAYAVAWLTVGDAALAEDVCQDALFRAWQRLRECHDPERFRSWLAQIVRRHALNAIRGRRECASLDASTRVAHGPTPDVEAEQHEARDRLRRALAQLTPEQRHAVTLFDLEGWSHREIAEVLATTPAMSRQHLMQGRRRLRSLLTEYGSEA